MPIRIGVNAGSLDKRLLEKYGKATAEALVESALWECSLFEEHGFRDIKISVKHNDPVVMIRAYRQLAEQCDYPLHLGVTEAGPAFQGTIKSAVAFGALLAEGIGDTIRVSLSAPPAEEVKVGLAILESLALRERGLEIVSCPSCGRAQVDVYTLADQVTAALDGFPAPLRVAVMGCVVNGPGEAREADLGVASGNGKGQIFVKGKVIKTVPESHDRGDARRGGAAPGRRDGRRTARGHRPARPSPCTEVARRAHPQHPLEHRPERARRRVPHVGRDPRDRPRPAARRGRAASSRARSRYCPTDSPVSARKRRSRVRRDTPSIVGMRAVAWSRSASASCPRPGIGRPREAAAAPSPTRRADRSIDADQPFVRRLGRGAAGTAAPRSR